MKARSLAKLVFGIAAVLVQNACLTSPDDDGPGTNPTPAPRHEVSVDRSPLRLVLHTDFAKYGLGHPVDITFTVENPSDEDVTLSFFSGQEHDIVVRDHSGHVVANFSYGKVYAMALHDRVVKAHDSIEYRWTWDQTTNDGESVPAGWYEIVAGLADSAGRTSGTLSLQIVD